MTPTEIRDLLIHALEEWEADIISVEEANEIIARRTKRIESERQDVQNKYDSLVLSIQRACAGTGCLNAHELRVKLDWAMDIVHNGFDDVDQEQINENYYEARLK